MKKMFVTVACALLSLAAFAQQSVKSDEGKPLVFSKAEFVGNLTVRMIRSDTARIEIKQSQSERQPAGLGGARTVICSSN